MFRKILLTLIFTAIVSTTFSGCLGDNSSYKTDNNVVSSLTPETNASKIASEKTAKKETTTVSKATTKKNTETTTKLTKQKNTNSYNNYTTTTQSTTPKTQKTNKIIVNDPNGGCIIGGVELY